jgi:hypothetical protein
VTFPRRIAALAALALAATLAPAGGAWAVTGLGGYVTDADTGLGVGQAKVSFTQDGSSSIPPMATTDPTGRFLFSALSGVTGRLDVAGPAGWLSAGFDGVAVPAGGFVQQDVGLRRDWAAIPGGAKLAGTSDDTRAAAGCGAAAALYGDQATGWSAAVPAPSAAAPTLTAELPTSVDVDTLRLVAGAVCGDDAGAALGRYRVETSADGGAWTTAAVGELGAADRGHPVVLVPAAVAPGVRFVRLTALGAQDPGAPQIDVRELQVLGKGPNVAPGDGVITLDTNRPQPKTVVNLTATFTDPDSTIVRYLWDFDNDGTWDQATLGPRVSHVWAGSGSYRVTAGARDFRGALGTASLSLRVAEIGAPVEPVLDRKPLVAFDPATGVSLPFRVRCAVQCRITGDMTIARALKRRLKLKSRVVARISKVYGGGGLADYQLTLNRRVTRKLQRSNLRKIKVLARVKVLDAKRRTTKASRRVTLR